MGRDITFHVERRGPQGWRRVDSGRSWYERRDSTLFNRLSSWADDDPTGPRGLPDDVSDDVRREAAAHDCGHAESHWDNGIVRVKADPPCGCLAGGGHAWLTVRELLALDWTEPKEHWADVADRDDHAFHDGGRAAHLEEVVATAGTAILDPWRQPDDMGSERGHEYNAMAALREGGRADGERLLITWQQPLWREVNVYWFATVLRMAHLAGDDPDSVRCVYWFS